MATATDPAREQILQSLGHQVAERPPVLIGQAVQALNKIGGQLDREHDLGTGYRQRGANLLSGLNVASRLS